MHPPFSAYPYSEDNQPFVFASYAQSDSGIVYPILKQLHTKGVRIWYDEGIGASDEWLARIAEAIKKCTTFLVFLTTASILRNNVKREISFALKRYDSDQIQVVPIYMEEIVLPDDLELALGPIQALMKYKVPENDFTSKIYAYLLPSVISEQKKETKPLLQNDHNLIIYKNISLVKSEHEVIQYLNDVFGPISMEDVISINTYGYIIEDTHVIGLGLAGLRLTEVPDCIQNLPFLRELTLAHNKLKMFPKNILSLSKLEKVNIEQNKLTELPNDISNLTSLTDLHMKNNKLISLPESITKLPKLSILDIRNNKIREFPKNFGNLKNLTELWGDSNELTALPESFGNLKSLRLLFLGYNPIFRLPDNFGELENLEEFEVISSAILPESIGKLKSLRLLGLFGDELKSLPIGILNLKKLKEITILEETNVSLEISSIFRQLKAKKCKITKI